MGITGAPVGPQEAAGASLTDNVGGLAVGEHSATRDHDGLDGGVVAVNHPLEPPKNLDGRLVISVKR